MDIRIPQIDVELMLEGPEGMKEEGVSAGGGSTPKGAPSRRSLGSISTTGLELDILFRRTFSEVT
eukprot:259990-Prorocentrum_minimum.AAC.1